MAHIVANAFWTAIWKGVESYALNALTNKLFGPKNKNNSGSPTYSIGTLQTQTNSNSVMPIIYGQVKCAGNNIWQDGSGTTVNRLVGFGIGKNAGVSDVRVDDIQIETLSGCNYTAYMGDGTQQIDGRVAKNTVTTYVYTDTVPSGVQTGETWTAGGYTWTAYYDTTTKAVRGRRSTGTTTKTLSTQEEKARVVGGLKYDAYLALTITANSKISSSPNVTAVWKGRIVKVYSAEATDGYTLDLKTGYYYKEAWSNNVWCVLDFMISIDGCNIPVSNIDIQSFITAAAYAQPGDGSRNWSINLILDEKKSRQDWLNDMLLCFRAFRTYQNGKHGILIDKPEPVSQIFNVKPTESIQHDWQELADDYERVIIKYIDPDYEWQKVGAPATIKPPYRNATHDDAGNALTNGNPLSKTVEVVGITNFKQASQHAWFYLNQAQTCPDYITYTCNKRALNRTIGDVIGIYDPITELTEEGLPYKRYRILGMTEPQGMSIQLYCREYNEALYSDELGSVEPVVSVSKLPNTTTAPPAVANLTAEEYGWMNSQGIHISNIDIAFTASNYFDTVSYVVTISGDNGTTWQYINTISDTSYRIGSVANGDYIVGVQAVNKAGILSARVTVAVSVVGKDNLPPNVDALLVEKLASGSYRFSFSLSEEEPIDLAGYRFKYNMGNSTWWDSAIALASGLVRMSPFETNAVPKGIVTVMVKAVDNAGNESANAAYAILGLGDTLANNILAEFDFSAFSGTKTNCHIDDGYLVADDSGDAMYPINNSDAMYPVSNNDLFYSANWPEIVYEDTFSPDKAGQLSFDFDMDGNSQIFYRRQYPYAMYGADYNPFYPVDDDAIYREGPYATYAGKVETVSDIHQVKLVVSAGKTQAIVRRLKAIVDVEDIQETLNDVEVSASGIRLPITKSYISIKRVGITLQEVSGSTAAMARIVDKDATNGPLIMLYDTSNNPVSGVVDADIQGY